MSAFFHRIESLSLVSGNKTSGFVLVVSADAARRLQKIKFTEQEYAFLQSAMKGRVLQSKLLPKKAIGNIGLQPWSGSACPLSFIIDPMFGGSIGSFLQELEQLGYYDKEDGEEDYDIRYVPHNVDTPNQALALLIMVETWAEWACGLLSRKLDADVALV